MRERVSYPLLWGFVVIVGVLSTRIAAARGDLAMDEIWSLGFVSSLVRSLSDVWAVRHDNNHPLNTFVMFCLGTELPGIYYRIIPVLLSTLTVWLAMRLTLKSSSMSGSCFAWLFVGASYLLTLHGTEARGYAYVVFFAYLSWISLQHVEASDSWFAAFIYAVSASLGFLSHLTFLYCFAGFGIWTLRKLQQRRSWPLLLAQVPPCVTAGLLYLYFIRGMEIGGGPESGILAALVSTLSVTGGGPLSGWGAVVAATLVAVVLVVAYFEMRKTDSAMAACYLTIIVLAPAFVLLKTRHAFIYPRYFLIPVSFALLLMAQFVDRWWRCGRVKRGCSMLLVTGYLIGNGWWSLGLLDHGRGDYSGALAFMRKHAAERQRQLVTSDHDLRNRTVFDYFASRLDATEGAVTSLEYRDVGDIPEVGVDWIILHNFEGDSPCRPTVLDRFGNQYQLQKTFRHRSLTGWNWWIYSRSPSFVATELSGT